MSSGINKESLRRIKNANDLFKDASLTVKDTWILVKDGGQIVKELSLPKKDFNKKNDFTIILTKTYRLSERIISKRKKKKDDFMKKTISWSAGIDKSQREKAVLMYLEQLFQDFS